MATATASVEEVCREAKRASRVLATLPRATKDAALEAIAAALREGVDEILEANRADLAAAREAGLSEALLDRLALDERRIEAMAAGVGAIASLEDPVGDLLEEPRRTTAFPDFRHSAAASIVTFGLAS